VAAASADGVVDQKNQILFTHHPASQSLGTPPSEGGELFLSAIYMQTRDPGNINNEEKAPLLLKEGWQPLRLTGWLIDR